ncbi:Peroxidase, family 2-domain-containing protein [Armillaria luteobubalina]|uniref:Peroxidase, family 2-domain-containing protein n=1 Tax=Armillaria luteobubalina TaxID=153913 RepID=A0AA39UVT4_9AGAR|nr:Peroxidase, family 2-domain-containing protein [Armillaria luteobubalina]
MYLSLAFVTAFFSAVHATIDLKLHGWQAPGGSDLRGPCPGLNTLANHGFLPRDGKNITIKMILDAGLEGFNIDPTILISAAKVGLLTTNAPDSFTLDDLKLHGTIEHDTSLSRSDFLLGDNVHFNETIYTTLTQSNPGLDYFNATSAGQVQKKRLADDTLANPGIINTSKEFNMRTGESALYLSVMGDPVTGVAPKQFVDIFFREERMPIEEGWTKPSTLITGQTISPISNIIEEASEWVDNGGCPIIRPGPNSDLLSCP